jgi:hypothetical protein
VKVFPMDQEVQLAKRCQSVDERRDGWKAVFDCPLAGEAGTFIIPKGSVLKVETSEGSCASINLSELPSFEGFFDKRPGDKYSRHCVRLLEDLHVEAISVRGLGWEDFPDYGGWYPSDNEPCEREEDTDYCEWVQYRIQHRVISQEHLRAED